MHSLLILLSTPVFCVLHPASQLRAFRSLMGVSPARAAALSRALVSAFLEQAAAPASYLSEEGGSLVLGIASGVWNILTLGYGSQPAAATSSSSSTESGGGSDSAVSSKPLADSALLLLLVLINHCTEGPNPYRDAIFHCSNVPFSSFSAKINIEANHVQKGDEENSPATPGETSSPESFQTDFGR